MPQQRERDPDQLATRRFRRDFAVTGTPLSRMCTIYNVSELVALAVLMGEHSLNGNPIAFTDTFQEDIEARLMGEAPSRSSPAGT